MKISQLAWQSSSRPARTRPRSSTVLIPFSRNGEADELLGARIARLRNEGERPQQALTKAKAQAAPQPVIDADMATKFSALVTEKLANGNVQAEAAYLRTIIDRVEAGEAKVRIIGEKTMFRDATAGKATNIRGLDGEWRARKDSNL